MLHFEKLSISGFEEVLQAENKDDGFLSFIAVHNTKRGRALGGIRYFPYKNGSDGLNDALRLARSMTYKSALAGLDLGGGKSVIVGDPHSEKKNKFLKFHAEAINYLQGAYIGAGDVGTYQQDMDILKETTPYIAGSSYPGSSGDPSRFTSWGVYLGIKSVAQKLFGNSSLKNKTIALQGLGKVGMKLAEFLFWEGAAIIGADKDEDACQKAAKDFGIEIKSGEEIHKIPCDIFSPCALGGILNRWTIPELKCQAVAGAANNQLKTPEDSALLWERGILYAPDFVINAGGIINTAGEVETAGYDPKCSLEGIEHIPKTLDLIFELSEASGKPPEEIAIDLAEELL